jgi:hypothetical protein
MSDQEHQQQAAQGFEQMDADAVCEKCGTVNDEGTLLCKVCGNNLRDQRARRMVQGGMPDLGDERPSKFRLFTGLLVTLGLLIFVYLFTNLEDIESVLVDSMSSDNVIGTDFWSGENASIYDNLWQDLLADPTPPANRKVALDSPIAETAFDGRYVIVRSGLLDSTQILGEANVQRLGDNVHFVVNIESMGAEMRGVAVLETQQGSADPYLVARNTASIMLDGEQHSVFGVALPEISGGHTVAGEKSMNSSGEQKVRAYRIR